MTRYGEQVEQYIDVYLRTPGLAKEDIAKALLARGNARRMSGERLLVKAQQGASSLPILPSHYYDYYHRSAHPDQPHKYSLDTTRGRAPSRISVCPSPSKGGQRGFAVDVERQDVQVALRDDGLPPPPPQDLLATDADAHGTPIHHCQEARHPRSCRHP